LTYIDRSAFATRRGETKASREAPMILSLFRRKPSPVPADIYAALVAAARRPVFYTRLGVPDATPARFDLLTLHTVLFLRRSRGRTQALTDLAQDVVDRLFLELDRALREEGVGDTSVPKRIKAFAGVFYGRAGVFEPALAAADAPALADALRRTVFDGAGQGDAEGLAAYALRADAALAASLSDGDILAGRLIFADV